MVCRMFFSPVIFPCYSGNVVEKRREATKKSYAFQVKATDWYNLLTERKKKTAYKKYGSSPFKKTDTATGDALQKNLFLIISKNIQKKTPVPESLFQ